MIANDIHNHSLFKNEKEELYETLETHKQSNSLNQSIVKETSETNEEKIVVKK